MKTIYRLFIFLLIISVSACVSTQSNLASGNDEDQDIGLGGTGMLANSGSGLGGTGIVGVITGFGSIFVNGIEIEYNNKTPLTVDGKSSSDRQLAIGDVVEVLTVDNKQHTDARIINLRHEVIGKVESVNPATSSFTVLGQTVLQNADNTPLPKTGNTVAVSGFRLNNKTIQATRVTLSNQQQSLLRTRTELPFKKNTNRWMVQTHVQNGKAAFYINGTAHTVSVKEAIKQTLTGPAQINILQLQVSEGSLKLNRVHDIADMMRGRQSLDPVRQPGIQTMPMRMNNLPGMPRMRR